MSSHYSPLPRLGTASSTSIDAITKEYKSGASYKGHYVNNKKVGRGTFIWPNGAKYVGEFAENMREGRGAQTWQDESTYEGDFKDDMRFGEGTHTWANKESYSGTFFRDRRHGDGEYNWPDGTIFTGKFYMDRREGYGKLVFANGCVFEDIVEPGGPQLTVHIVSPVMQGAEHRAFIDQEHMTYIILWVDRSHGLYKQDEREGPGVLTYPDGRQDVGLWHREKLVKLCSAVAGAFTMHDHREFEYFPEEHVRYINPESHSNQLEVLDSIVHPPEQFNYTPEVDITNNTNDIFNDSLHSKSTAIDVESFEEEFFKGAEKCKEKVKAWNLTPSSVSMQRHVIRFKYQEKQVKFSIENILKGERSGFGAKGPIETASEEFLKSTLEGDLCKVSRMLNCGEVYVDVSDRHGHTALLGAAVNWHQEIINCLLDNGADVNKLNDEGVSALAACHVFFYPIDSFKYNIAERYLQRPADFEQEEGYDVNEAVKSLIPTTPKKKASATSEKRNGQVDVKKIQKLRQEYGSKSLLVIPEGAGSALGDEEKENLELDGGRTSADSGVDPTERKLGTLQVKRVTKTSIDDMMALNEDQLSMPTSKKEHKESEFHSDYDEDYESDADLNDFESLKSVRNLRIDVTDQLIERCATQLSSNEMIVGRKRLSSGVVGTVGTVRRLAMDKSHHTLMETTIRLLLKRGADPNASSVPMPVLFFAIKAADVEAVRELLVKGASTSARISDKKGGLAPLHIACAIPGDEGVKITELLLDSLADPDVRAAEDDSFLNRNLEEEWSKDVIDESSKKISGGRTPLHIACARDDNYRVPGNAKNKQQYFKNACRVVHLLLQHHGNPNLLCNGHSPLALAIASGNDMAVDELLMYGADPCLPLTHGVGSALCVATSTEYENRRTPDARIRLVDKLIKAGADILAPIQIGPKRITGTAVDYAYYMYNLDRRIAHMPYHALTHTERETFNARRRLLAHVGDILRIKAVERERQKLDEEEMEGRRSRSPSPNFVYTGAGASVPKNKKNEGRVSFGKTSDQDEGDVRKPLLRYCYECGRSVGVRLSPCTRCKEVYYCSKACKLKAWNARHKEECVRIGEKSYMSISEKAESRSKSPSPTRGGDKRIDSPTPGTDPDGGKLNTVSGIMGSPGTQRIKPFLDESETRSVSVQLRNRENPQPVLVRANTMLEIKHRQNSMVVTPKLKRTKSLFMQSGRREQTWPRLTSTPKSRGSRVVQISNRVYAFADPFLPLLPPLDEFGRRRRRHPSSLPGSPYGSQISLYKTANQGMPYRPSNKRSSNKGERSKLRRSASWDGSEEEFRSIRHGGRKKQGSGAARGSKHGGSVKTRSRYGNWMEDGSRYTNQGGGGQQGWEEEFLNIGRRKHGNRGYADMDEDLSPYASNARRNRAHHGGHGRDEYDYDYQNDERSGRNRRAWSGDASRRGLPPNGVHGGLKVSNKNRSMSAGMERSHFGRGGYPRFDDPLLKERALAEQFAQNAPWKCIDGKWVYIDNYSFV